MKKPAKTKNNIKHRCPHKYRDTNLFIQRKSVLRLKESNENEANEMARREEQYRETRPRYGNGNGEVKNPPPRPPWRSRVLEWN